MPAVSVACAVLNERDDIDSLVESLMRQTLAPAEVIIVDGGSTDGTWERLEAARAKYPTLVPIRDESCSLQRSPGPIARGRNVAIAAASSDIVACADAGCTYHPDWLANLTAPILAGDSQYSVGGSYIDLTDIDLTNIDPRASTIWDIASAPFFGVKLNADAATKSCTARSMAFPGGRPRRGYKGRDGWPATPSPTAAARPGYLAGPAVSGRRGYGPAQGTRRSRSRRRTSWIRRP